MGHAPSSREQAAVELVEALKERIALLEASLAHAESQLALRAQVDVLMAHEVRTPLTVINGTLETIRSVPLDAESAQELLELAAAHASSLAEIVDDLLGSTPGQGMVFPRAQLKRVSLLRLAQDALNSAGAEIDPSRVTMDGLDLTITTAPGRLRSILANFFENAARYGGKGPVTCRAEPSDDGLLRVSVLDRGRGLRGRDPEDLFEPFVQGDEGHPRGRGLGLYLVRMLAKSLGGTAQLAERPDGGTVAWVEFPQRREGDIAPARDDSVDGDVPAAALAGVGESA
jgi:signal transduction histidine kinase